VLPRAELSTDFRFSAHLLAGGCVDGLAQVSSGSGSAAVT